MQDSTKDTQTATSDDEDSITGGPFKVILGFSCQTENFFELHADPALKEIMRINTQFLERWNADHPAAPLVMDASFIVEALPSEVF